MNNDNRKEYFRKYGIVTALVFEIVALVFLGFLIGGFLDKKIGSDPYLMMTGVILGFIGGIYRFYRSTRKFLK